MRELYQTIMFHFRLLPVIFYIYILSRNFGYCEIYNKTKLSPAISIKNSTFLQADRYSRFLNFPNDIYNVPYKSVDNNEIDKEGVEYEDPAAPLHAIYTDCLLQLSFPCVQRKFLVFLDRLGRLKGFSLIGDFLSVIRVKRELGPILKEADLEARLNPTKAQTVLATLTELIIERFFRNHILRVNLPPGITASLSDTGSRSFGDTIDINVTKTFEEVTGRGKGDKKMKKLLQMMMTGLMGKMAFMGPMLLLLIKLKALKALILSKLALIMSLLHLFKGGGKKGGGHSSGKEVIIVHDSHGGGGGHDAYSSGWASGGGGWSGGGGGSGGWLAPAGHGDSYSSGVHTGGGDSTYAGADAYAGGHGGWAAPAGHGWGRKSSSDPHWVAYKAYIPEEPEE